MGCCRGRSKKLSSTPQTPECKTLEDGGARTAIHVMATAQGVRLVIPTAQHGYLDLGSFLSAFRCDGPTARLLRRYLPTIQQALASNAAAFTPYRSGIGITDLIRVAERATKGAGTNAAEKEDRRVSPFPAR